MKEIVFKMDARISLLVMVMCASSACLASRGYKQRYVIHSSQHGKPDPVFHLSQHYPEHRYRKQDILKEHPSKRGFLANLANLLSDADMLSKRNSGKSAVSSASSSVRLDPTENPSSKTIMAPIARSSTGKAKDEVDEPTPSAKTVEKSLKTEEKESAPIFALFHGKIVPLGKLPDTSFKKSHAEVRSDEKQSKEESKKEETGKAEIKETHQVKSDIGEHTKEGENTKPKQNIEKRQQGRTLSPSQISRLSSYFHNLESKSKEAVETRMIKSHKKDVTGTAKDEVPELLPDVKNSEFLKHVKGILLDDGKMVALKGKQSQIEEQAEPEKSESSFEKSDGEEAEKSYAISNSLLPQLTKSKEETADPVSRTTQSVTLNIDTLKGLLGKSNGGVSLAKLLNKQPDEAAINTQEEDPGTIEDFAAGGLKKTNEYRAEHHAAPLVWSDELASEAQKMAEHLADVKSLEISSDLEKKGYGENVAKVWANFKTAGDAATNMWYHQSENYHFDDPHLDQNTGQFAQLIWKDSKELGMGVAKSIDDINNKYVYVVALYRPPGNIETTLRDNVMRKGNDTTDVYSTFFKRSSQIKHSGVLLPKHQAKPNNEKH